MKAVMIISVRLNINFLQNFKVFIDAGYGSSGKPFTLYSEEITQRVTENLSVCPKGIFPYFSKAKNECSLDWRKKY